MSMERFVAQKVGGRLVGSIKGLVRTPSCLQATSSPPPIWCTFSPTRSRNDTLFTQNAFAVLILKRLSPDVSRWIPEVKQVAQYPKRWSKNGPLPRLRMWLFRARITTYSLWQVMIVILLWVDICCHRPPARAESHRKGLTRSPTRGQEVIDVCYQNLIYMFQVCCIAGTMILSLSILSFPSRARRQKWEWNANSTSPQQTCLHLHTYHKTNSYQT